jgi:2-polyprenyl-6-methoxyphenol hydroxylase-like FAD-dependent oxidoreductase
MALPVVVIGAGPIGLAAAAHLLERGLDPLVLERAGDVGASVADWGHVRLFSPWRYDVDRAAARLLERSGWTPPDPELHPTGAELRRLYLQPLAMVPELEGRIRLRHRVMAITRRDTDKIRTRDRASSPFVLRVATAHGATVTIDASAVIDASGTWWTPNPIGGSGLPAFGEPDCAELRYGIPDVLGIDRKRYAGRRTLVVGAGHSAANTLLALAELAHEARKTSIVWATRGDDLSRVLGGGDADGLPARGKLGADLRTLMDAGRIDVVRRLHIEAITPRDDTFDVSGRIDGGPHVVTGIERIVACTGQRPDTSIHRELRVDLDPALESVRALAPLIDPNEHSCGTVRPHGADELTQPEPGFFVVGGKSYGRAPTFLLATGYEQVRSVAALLAGDLAAARRVELDLPETGVCRSDAGSACCAPGAAACC